MQKSSGLADQQVTNDVLALTWLGAVIDCEGCLTYTWNVEVRQSAYPRLVIVNTDSTIIEKCCSILSSHNIPHHVAERYPRSYVERGWKARTDIEIGGLKRLSRALPILIPYLIAKRGKAERMLEFITSRLRVGRGVPYSERELEIVSETRRTNRHPAPHRLHALPANP